MTPGAKVRRVACLMLTLLAIANGGARADDIEAFYKGRQIRFIIGAEPGSDYDVWARVIIRALARQSPGAPTIVPQNMPGAGQIIATNYLYTVAERDGSVIGMIGRNLPYTALMATLTGDTQVRFDPARFGWIGSPEADRRVCAARGGAVVKTADDLLEHDMLVGGAGAGTAVSQAPALLARLLGLRLKLVEGYRSGPNVLLGMDRGEIDGICITYEALLSTRAADLASGKLRVLFNFEREPIAGTGAPSVYRFARTDDQRRILAVFNASVELGRPVVAPPGIPAARLAALRQAFAEALDDAELRAETGRLRLRVTPISGETLAAKVADLMKTSPELLQSVDKLMK